MAQARSKKLRAPAAKAPAVPTFRGVTTPTGQETDPAKIALNAATAPPTQTPTSGGEVIAANAQIGSQQLRDDIQRRGGAAGAQSSGFTGQLDLGGQFNAPQAPLSAAQRLSMQAGGGPALDPSMQKDFLGGRTTPGVTPTIKPLTGGTQTSKVGVGAEQARSALGPAPTIDMGLADRGQSSVQDALGLSRQVVDAALTPVDQAGLVAATGDARTVLDRLLNGANTAERLGTQTLRTQMALARSAAGGPGAVQEAMRQAQFAAPELQAQATESAVAEEMQRNTAAGAITGQLQQSAVAGQQNETARIGTAADAASGFAQGALGSRQQDIGIAAANQQASSKLIDAITQLTGTQLELDQRNQELIGQMARDAASMEFNWGTLDAAQQKSEWDRWVQVYGIDKQAAAQLEAIAASQKKHPLDYINSVVGVIGGAASIVGAASGKA